MTTDDTASPDTNPDPDSDPDRTAPDTTSTEATARAQFDAIDWGDITQPRFPVGTRTLVFLAVATSFLAGFAYDHFVLSEDAPLIDIYIANYGVTWNLTGVDWLFTGTLIVVAFFGVYPLYKNRRMTMYYWREFRKNKAAVAGLAYLIVVFVLGIVGPLVLQRPEINMQHAYQPPLGITVSEYVPQNCLGVVQNSQCHGTWAHPLGTTQQGKDIAKLMVFGMRVSMQVGLIAMLIRVTIATTVGTTAAYFGGWVDEILMRYVDLQLTFPVFFLYLLLVYLFGGSLLMLIVIFGITGWGGIARLVRSEALQRREEEFIQVARSAGASSAYTIRRHIVPNVSNTIITAASLNIPILILSEAALSFLGLGDPTVYSWGQVISAGRGDIATAWWVSTIPGVFLFLTILSFNFLGDALRDALDPRHETN